MSTKKMAEEIFFFIKKKGLNDFEVFNKHEKKEKYEIKNKKEEKKVKNETLTYITTFNRGQLIGYKTTETEPLKIYNGLKIYGNYFKSKLNLKHYINHDFKYGAPLKKLFIYDKRYSTSDFTILKNYIKAIYKNLKKEISKSEISISFERSIREKSIVNTAGMSGNYSESLFSLEISIKNDSLSYNYEDQQRYFSHFENPDVVSKKIVDELLKIESLSNRKKHLSIEKNIPFLFSGKSFAIILEEMFKYFHPKNIKKFENFKNKKIFSDNISIVSSHIQEGFVGSKPFDDDGILGSEEFIIENGVIKNNFTSRFWKLVHGVDGIFSGKKGERLFSQISYPNIILKKGIYFPEELFSGFKKIFVVKEIKILESSDKDFSILLKMNGFLLKNGKSVIYYNDQIVKANIFELLKRVLAVGNDIKNHKNFYSPSLLIIL